MLSANASALPSKTVRPSPAWHSVRRFLRRLFSPAGTCIPDLPDELHGDLGLSGAVPESREGQFWEDKRRSEARDLPL